MFIRHVNCPIAHYFADELWMLPVGMAVLIINNSGNSTSVTVDTARLLNMTGDSNIRSIWDRADTGVTQGYVQNAAPSVRSAILCSVARGGHCVQLQLHRGTFKVTVPSMDSAFVLLSPHSVAEL